MAALFVDRRMNCIEVEWRGRNEMRFIEREMIAMDDK